MKYRLVGRSGLRVSELGLGTMTFGEDWGWGAPEDTCREIYTAFREAGGNFVDTANMYVNGDSERIVGDLIAADRDEVVLATKFTNVMGDGSGPGTKAVKPNGAGNGRKNLMQSVEASLKRLKTDRIDLLWVHSFDFATPLEELMRGLDDLVRMGKVLYVGVSDTPAWAVSAATVVARERGLTPFIAQQIEYNLTQRTPDREFLPMADYLGLSTVAWSPLAGGILTGKYNANPNGEDRRLDVTSTHALSDANLKLGQLAIDVAKEVGCTPAQASVAWIMKKGIIPLIAATTPEQIADNLGAADVELSEEQMQRFEEASKVALGFPHDFLELTREITWGNAFAHMHKDGHKDGIRGLLPKQLETKGESSPW